MITGLDLFATLQHIVKEAVGILPSSQRGLLLTRDGERLLHRLSVGFEGVLASPPRLFDDAGPATELSMLEPADGARVVPAVAWYRAHLPDEPALHFVP